MSYRITEWSNVEDEVRRIGREQIGRALGAIDDPSIDLHEKIHAARKRCKKVRGLARLVRPALGKKAYKRLNAHFRDAARRVSDDRDAAVFIATYDKVCDHYDGQIDRRAMASIRAGLTRRLREVEPGDDGRLTALERLRSDLQAGLKLFDEIELDEAGFDAVADGLAKTYGRARDALEAARDKPSAKAFHELRKRVKYHRYHLKLLRSLWKQPVEALGDEASDLGDLLGDAHDLAVIDAHLCAQPEGLGNLDDVDAFRGLAMRRRRSLESQALIASHRLLADKPKWLVKRMAAWREAVDEATGLRHAEAAG